MAAAAASRPSLSLSRTPAQHSPFPFPLSLTHSLPRSLPLSSCSRASYKSPGEAYVEGDASSASYFLAGATITGGTVVVEGCGSDSLQGDKRFADVMGLMGAKVRRSCWWRERAEGWRRCVSMPAGAAATVAARRARQ